MSQTLTELTTVSLGIPCPGNSVTVRRWKWVVQDFSNTFHDVTLTPEERESLREVAL